MPAQRTPTRVSRSANLCSGRSPRNAQETGYLMRIDRKAIATAVVIAFLSTSCVLSGSALAGFTAAVKNTGSTAGSGTDFLTATNGGVQCTSVPSGSTIPSTTSFPCAGSQFPSTVPATGSGTGTETLTASG